MQVHQNRFTFSKAKWQEQPNDILSSCKKAENKFHLIHNNHYLPERSSALKERVCSGQNLQSHPDSIRGQHWGGSSHLCVEAGHGIELFNAMQLKSSIPAIHSDEPSCVQLNENTVPTIRETLA